ncbi:MAG: TlpA disulfide reductase family protein [Pseudomonadota bacterium]
MKRMIVATVASLFLVGACMPTSASDTLPNFAWLDEPEPAPDVLFSVEGGDMRTLEDYQGKVIVLNFWATWCPPCRDEMPSLDRLEANHGGDDFVVMAMSVDRGGENQIREFYDEIAVTSLGVFSDPTQKVSRDFRVLGLPTTIVIDHQGQMVARLVGTAEWDGPAALKELLPLIDAARQANGGTDQVSLDVNP